MPSRDQLMQALRNADAAGDKDGATRIAQMIQAMPADAPAQAPAAAPAAPARAPFDRAAYMAQLAKEREQNAPLNSMSFGEKMLVGAGQGFTEMGQGADQLYGMLKAKLTGDTSTLDDIAKTRESNRQADEALSHTWGGKLGNIGANALMAAVPVGGLEVAGGKMLANPLVAGMLSGAMSGAIQPTDEGQSHLKNAEVGGALGLFAPAAGKIVGGATNLVTGGKAKLLKSAMKMFKSADPDAQAALANAQNQGIKTQLGQIMSADHQIPISKDAAAEVARIKNSYGNALDQDTKNAMDQYILAGNNNGSAPANLVAEARSGAIKNAKAADGAVSNGYYGFQRALDNSTDDYFNSLPKSAEEFWTGQSTASKLKALRSAYGKTVEGSPLDPTSPVVQTKLSLSSPALRARLLKQLQISGVIGAESQATNPKPMNIDIVGGTTYPADQPPPQ